MIEIILALNRIFKVNYKCIHSRYPDVRSKENRSNQIDRKQTDRIGQ